MKRILLVASLFIPSFSFAQSNHFGLIQDKDGYVNVRDQASTKSKVVDKLNNGEVVSFVGDYAENQFSYVLYLKDGSGYIHDSRINKFKDFQKWKLQSSDMKSAGYSLGQNKVHVMTHKAQFNPSDFKKSVPKGQTELVYTHYKNKPFYGTDGVLPTGRLQFSSMDILYQGKNIHIPSQDLENYFISETPLSKGSLQDFADAEIYSKGQDLYIINPLAGGGAAQYVLMIHIQNGKVVKIQAWNESI